MANTAQARKRARQTEKHDQLNTAQRSELRTSVKKVVKAIAGGNADAARDALRAAEPVIDSMARKGLIHKNKAARHKSRLNQKIRSLANG